VLLQVVGLDVAGLTVLSGAHVRTVVVVEHRVVLQIHLLCESFTAARDIAVEWPLAGVCPLVGRKDVRYPEGGPAAQDIALEWPLARVGSLMPGGFARRR
jgi:hypothetical protein